MPVLASGLTPLAAGRGVSRSESSPALERYRSLMSDRSLILFLLSPSRSHFPDGVASVFSFAITASELLRVLAASAQWTITATHGLGNR